MTTFALKDLPPLRSNRNDLPDFTEFRLDPFQVQSTTHLLLPDSHREATRVFSLQLQPRPHTQLANSLKQFQDQSYIHCGPNQAHQSPPHLSLLGKIAVDCNADYKIRWQAVDALIQTVDEEIQKALKAATLTTMRHPPSPTFGGYSIKNKPTRSVSMRIAVPRLYTQLARTLQVNLSNNNHIRLDHPPSFLDAAPAALSRTLSSTTASSTLNLSASSTIQRVPLAYNVLRSISRDDALRIRSLAKDLIKVNRWVNGKESSWELVLHEVMLESQAVVKTQQIKIINTWPLDSNYAGDHINQSALLSSSRSVSSPSTFSSSKTVLPFPSSLVPTSLRVKLSVLSSHLK